MKNGDDNYNNLSIPMYFWKFNLQIRLKGSKVIYRLKFFLFIIWDVLS